MQFNLIGTVENWLNGERIMTYNLKDLQRNNITIKIIVLLLHQTNNIVIRWSVKNILAINYNTQIHKIIILNVLSDNELVYSNYSTTAKIYLIIY